MIRFCIIALLSLVLNFPLKGQVGYDTTLIKVFGDTYTILASDDESMIAVLNNDSYIEFFQLDSMKLIRTIKATRNTWLSKAFFYNNNLKLYFDYGVSVKTKYKVLDIKSGIIQKVECINVPKGCTFRAIKICHPDHLILRLEKKPYIFKKNSIDIEMYQVNN
jgi:hypothetical protein